MWIFPICRGIYHKQRGISLLEQFKLPWWQECKAHPMVGRGAVLGNTLPVFLCRVSCVMVPPVVGVLCMKRFHVIVAIGLCKNRCGSYSEIFAVTLDDCGMRQIMVAGKPVSVDNQCLRSYLQCIDGTVHSQDARPKYVQFVDFLCCHYSQCPTDGIAFYLVAKGIPLFCRKKAAVFIISYPDKICKIKKQQSGL